MYGGVSRERSDVESRSSSFTSGWYSSPWAVAFSSTISGFGRSRGNSASAWSYSQPIVPSTGPRSATGGSGSVVTEPAAPSRTRESTINFRAPAAAAALPPGEPLLGVFRSRWSADGLIDEDGELWSPDGVLLAHRAFAQRAGVDTGLLAQRADLGFQQAGLVLIQIQQCGD